jgi:hypothetical protein
VSTADTDVREALLERVAAAVDAATRLGEGHFAAIEREASRIGIGSRHWSAVVAVDAVLAALSAELAEAKAEIERLTAECYRAWDVAVEERLRRLEREAGIESPPEPEPDPLAGRLPAPAGPLRVEYGLVWDDLGSADLFPTLEQARAAARGFDEPVQVVRIETWPVADDAPAAEPEYPKPCSNCGALYSTCTERIRAGRRACCGTCGYTATHDQNAWEAWDRQRTHAPSADDEGGRER